MDTVLNACNVFVLWLGLGSGLVIRVRVRVGGIVLKCRRMAWVHSWVDTTFSILECAYRPRLSLLGFGSRVTW